MGKNGYYLRRTKAKVNRNISGNDEKRISCCIFCRQDTEDEIQLGKLITCTISKTRKIKIHYYCMLLASGLQQRGKSDEDGILGFLYNDVIKEKNRAARIGCHYCKKRGASIWCSFKSCRTAFHLPCGIEHFSLHQFFDAFQSFCVKHKPKQFSGRRVEADTSQLCCCICLDTINQVTDNGLYAPCCSKWFHRWCLQNFALNAGYFFRCPMCNDKELFIKEMMKFGIYIPQQDASWELENEAYSELLHHYSQCDAEVCLCANGRNFGIYPWDIILCMTCGSKGIHSLCGKDFNLEYWECEGCRKISLALIEKRKKASESTKTVSRKPFKSKHKQKHLMKNVSKPTDEKSKSKEVDSLLKPMNSSHTTQVSQEDSKVSNTEEVIKHLFSKGKYYEEEIIIIESDSDDDDSVIIVDCPTDFTL